MPTASGKSPAASPRPARPAVDVWLSWQQQQRQYWMLLALAVLGLGLGRWTLMLCQSPPDWHPAGRDLLLAFWTGARFDLKNAAILLGLPLFLSLLLPSAWRQRWLRGLTAWQSIALGLINLLMVVNYYYIAFYDSPINGLIFGLTEDGTLALLQTLWQDFPVLWLLFGIALLTGIQVTLARRWGRRLQIGRRGWRLALLISLSLLATVGLARGSLGKLPLRTMHLAVSSDALVNLLVPNGVVALQMAWHERQATDIGSATAGLAGYGYTSLTEAVYDAGLAPRTQALAPQQAEALARQALWRSWPAATPTQTTRPPNVLLAVMEGWGRHLLDYDDPSANDLLGRLRPWMHGKADYFSKALSSQHGTYQSLEALLLDTPVSPLLHSRYGYHPYPTAVARHYQQAGYRTIFLSGGQDSWRKLDSTLLRQGFDTVLGESAIQARYPDASTHTWGVDDVWLFRYAQTLIDAAEADGVPLFLVMLSTTNHPPFRVPPDYTPAPLDPNRLGNALAVTPELGRTILTTYQYANDALGGFLDALEAQGTLAHTLFAATGDHNTRQIISYPDSDQLHDKYGVPILIWMPPAYRGEHTADTQAWASHQDIMPTLMHHSLQDQSVAVSGRNLYAPSSNVEARALALISDDSRTGSGNLVSDAGAVAGLGHPRFLHWGADGRLHPTTQPAPLLLQQWRMQRAWLALRDWRIRDAALRPACLNANFPC